MQGVQVLARGAYPRVPQNKHHAKLHARRAEALINKAGGNNSIFTYSKSHMI